MHSHHGHSHSHHEHHDHAPQALNTAFMIAVSLTLIYTGAEVVYGLIAQSMSLLADAAHNLGDVLGLILSWIANWLLTFPARKRYSYGFKRTTIIAALANAFILVATSALIAYQSIYKLIHLQEVNEHIVIVIGLTGIVVNFGCSMLFMKSAKSDLNIRSAFWHLLADALILVGVVISAVIITLTGWMWIDPIVGLIIVGIVLWGTWGLLRDSLHLILDGIPHYVDYTGVKEYLHSIPGVTAVHDFHIWGLSTREVALTAHLIMPNKPLNDADHKRINHDLHSKFNVSHITLQVESGSGEDPCARIDKC
jgi:cobalt-zinc-cadmium efflux system protein